jgi:chemotaxis protein CheY-P-specific phosphatase CheC
MALANAADAFSKMAGEQVLLSNYDIRFIQREAVGLVLSEQHEAEWYILTTPIVGKFEAKTFLLFNRPDVKKLLSVFLPGQSFVEESPLSEFQSAILLELDNIVTAAMVTQLSNFTSLSAYGDVPSLKQLSRDDTIDYFSASTAQFELIMHVQARFRSSRTQMNPLFICFFKQEFLTVIKKLIASENHLNLTKIK